MNGKDGKKRVLVWLPSPLGDAVMCTPALKALRENLSDCEIYFLASPAVRQTLSPTDYADQWIEPCGSVVKNASRLKAYNFDTAVLFKNSFSCALAVFLAGIKQRLGYYRDCRGIFLNQGKPAPKESGKYKPAPMMDYYMGLLECIGIKTQDKTLSLKVSQNDAAEVREKLPKLFEDDKLLVVLVPGGAFGPSKCWPVEHYAAAADYFVEKYDARVVVSVAPNESDISGRICSLAKNELTDLAQTPLSLGQLKALISLADIVIANDTGPRHIAIALRKAVVTVFGPNDPRWTDSRHPLEIQIVTDELCAPCQKPVCPNGDGKCMRNISVGSVCAAADKLLKRHEL